MGIVIKDGDYIQENISYRAEDYVSLSNCLVLTRKRSNHHMFWNRKCFSIFFLSSSLTNFSLFTARTKLVHKLDVKQQHENWSSIKPLFLVLIDQVLNGLMPPAENMAILMEILDKKGKKLKFSFFVLYLIVSLFSDVFRHVISDANRKQYAYSYNLPLEDPNRDGAIKQHFANLLDYCKRY